MKGENEPMTNDSQKKYDKKCRMYGIRINKEKDKKIVEKLDSVTNVNNYIRKLIMEDLNKDHTLEKIQDEILSSTSELSTLEKRCKELKCKLMLLKAELVREEMNQ